MSDVTGVSAVEPVAPPTRGTGLSWAGVSVLTGAHLVHDMSLGFLGILLPFLREDLGFSLFLAGLLLPAQQAGSLLQPLMGQWADRVGQRRFVITFLILTPVAMSLMGLSPAYVVLLLVVAVGGLSSAAYHPAGSSLLTNYAGSRWGTGLAIYHFGGNVGLGLGPLAAGFVVAQFGLRATPVLALPALLMAAAVATTLRADGGGRGGGATTVGSSRWLWKHRRVFLPLGVVILGRALGAGGLTLFLPTLLVERGYALGFVAALTSGYFLFGGVGGLAAGWLSDRIGRRRIIAVLLLVSPFSILGFLFIDGWLGMALLLLAATALLGEQPVIMAMIQEWAPDRRGSVVGMVLGAQFVLAGLGTSLVGWMADQWGLTTAFQYVALAPLMGLAVVRALPTGRLEPAPAPQP